MNKKLVILISVLLIGIIMVSVHYLQNNVKANTDYVTEIHSVDSDYDHLPDYIESELGTDPFNKDTDGDMIDDMDEIYLGTSPVEWDTDNDHMADGNEIGGHRGSTSPFHKDSDKDGLPDPWEDNDGDELLNREEQLRIHDGLCFYMSGFEDPPLASTDPNNADTDGDGWSDGEEVQVNSTYGNTNPPPVDRLNPDLDIANPNSWATFFMSNTGWDPATFADWRAGLKLAGSYNLLPSSCTKIMWYHRSPYYRWEQQTARGVTTQNFTAWLNETYYGTWSQLRGPLDRYSTYKWNLYDCDPTLNDTDYDLMDDNWDPEPLRINLRNGTYAAINTIRPLGGSVVTVGPPFETQWNYFGRDISIVELEKGDIVEINVSVGLQQCDPSNPGTDNWDLGKYSPIRVVFRFRPVLLGQDGKPHTGGDDDWNATNVARLTRTFTNAQYGMTNIVPGMNGVAFLNHLNIVTTISFFYQTFDIRIPSHVPSGHIAITVETDTTNNFYYFPSVPHLAY